MTMRKLMIGVVLAVVLAIGSPAGAMGIQRVDCNGFSDWLGHNGDTLMQIGTILVTEVGGSYFTLPGASNGQANVHAVGMGLQVSRLYGAAYVSPLAMLNSVLGLVCLEASA